MMRLGLNQLRVFEAVTRCGSFLKAAERLAVTPPAVSLQIRQLEEACAAPLFERLGRRVRLTSAGETLRDYAAQIFALVTDAERAMEHDRGFANARLRIVTSATAAAYYLPPLWTALTHRYPGLQVEVAVENSQRVQERLVSLTDDIGVLGGETTHPDLVFVPFVHDLLAVIVPPSHPWAKRRSITAKALRGERLILREVGSASRALIERELRHHGVQCQAAMQIASNEVIKRAVEIGNGVSLMSRAVISREIESGHLHAVALRERGFSRTLHLAYHRQRQQSVLIQTVLSVAAALRVGKSAAHHRGARSH